MKRRKNLRVKPPECNSGLDERVARSPFNPFEHGAMERGSANNSYTYTFPVDHEESRGKKLGQGNNRRSKSVEPGAWQQAAQAQTDKSTDILPPPRSPPRELTRDEREKFKQLPRPASATVAKPEIRSRPASTHGRARSSERPASREGGVRPESSSGSEKKMSQKAVMMRLRPKLFEQSVSELGSQTSQQQKTLGCPECFHAFGGLCVQHLSTSWQGSIKQVDYSHHPWHFGTPVTRRSHVVVMAAGHDRERGAIGLAISVRRFGRKTEGQNLHLGAPGASRERNGVRS